jgi:hypothetical protein
MPGSLGKLPDAIARNPPLNVSAQKANIPGVNRNEWQWIGATGTPAIYGALIHIHLRRQITLSENVLCVSHRADS